MSKRKLKLGAAVAAMLIVLAPELSLAEEVTQQPVAKAHVRQNGAVKAKSDLKVAGASWLGPESRAHGL